MDKFTHRLMFSSLALVPAGAALLIALIDSALVSANLLTFACSLVALTAALHPGVSATFAQEPAMRFGPAPSSPHTLTALHSAPVPLPSTEHQTTTVARALAAELPTDPNDPSPDAAAQAEGFATDLADTLAQMASGGAPDALATATLQEPLSREQATALVLRRSLAAWGAPDLGDLDANRLLTLFLLTRVLTTTPGEAGRLAQHFRRPDAVLALRDEVERHARIRAEWDRNERLYLATYWLWSRQRSEAGTPSLMDTLSELGPPDIDLWHRIVLEHDPSDRNQRDAALWCLRQTTCDRATVAAYLAQAALDGRLTTAARRGNRRYLATIRQIIESWNKGHYRTQELALDPPDALAAQAPRIQETFAKLADISGQPWPFPAGAFIAYEGRAPRLRAAWALDNGRLSQDPQRSDYFDAPPAPRPSPHLL